MSQLSSFGPFHKNATWLPSGERLGCISYPGYAVRGTAGEALSDSRGNHAALRITATLISPIANAIAAAIAQSRPFFHNGACSSAAREGFASWLCTTGLLTSALNRYPCFGTVSIHSTPSSASAFR